MTSKKMFKVYGVFHADKMFARVNLHGEVHLKSDDLTITKSVAAVAPKYLRVLYFSIPEAVFCDGYKLDSRARESIKYPDKG